MLETTDKVCERERYPLVLQSLNGKKKTQYCQTSAVLFIDASEEAAV